MYQVLFSKKVISLCSNRYMYVKNNWGILIYTCKPKYTIIELKENVSLQTLKKLFDKLNHVCRCSFEAEEKTDVVTSILITSRREIVVDKHEWKRNFIRWIKESNPRLLFRKYSGGTIKVIHHGMLIFSIHLKTQQPKSKV